MATRSTDCGSYLKRASSSGRENGESHYALRVRLCLLDIEATVQWPMCASSLQQAPAVWAPTCSAASPMSAPTSVVARTYTPIGKPAWIASHTHQTSLRITPTIRIFNCGVHYGDDTRLQLIPQAVCRTHPTPLPIAEQHLTNRSRHHYCAIARPQQQQQQQIKRPPSASRIPRAHITTSACLMHTTGYIPCQAIAHCGCLLDVPKQSYSQLNRVTLARVHSDWL